MGKGNFVLIAEIAIKANGLKTDGMGKEPICLQIHLQFQETGLMGN